MFGSFNSRFHIKENNRCKIFGVLAMFGAIAVMALAHGLTLFRSIRKIQTTIQMVVCFVSFRFFCFDLGRRKTADNPIPQYRLSGLVIGLPTFW